MTLNIIRNNFFPVSGLVRCRFCSSGVKHRTNLTNAVVRRKKNELFDAEKKRQTSLVTRVEKIEVNYVGNPQKCTLVMNKNISTPYDCAKHIHEIVTKRSAIALVNNKIWDMHRPLEDDCELNFLHFKEYDPYSVNKAFWRSCSFILGYIIEHAFKDDYYIELQGWPRPSIQSGSFVYDADLKMDNWAPRQDELNTLSTMGTRLCVEDNHFERLQVDASVALKIFEDNRFKTEQIPAIAAASESGNSVTLYRLLDHIDISGGPMICSTDQITKFSVVSVHSYDSSAGQLYRFQGLAIPVGFSISSFAYDIISDRARKMNFTGLPNCHSEEEAVKKANQQKEEEKETSNVNDINVAAKEL